MIYVRKAHGPGGRTVGYTTGLIALCWRRGLLPDLIATLFEPDFHPLSGATNSRAWAQAARLIPVQCYPFIAHRIYQMHREQVEQRTGQPPRPFEATAIDLLIAASEAAHG